MKTKKTAGRIALDILSIFFAVVFLAPVIWALFVSLQHEGKQISSIVSWFTPPYTISNYFDIIKNSSVPLWFINSLFIAVVVTVATVLVTGMAAYALALIPFKVYDLCTDRYDGSRRGNDRSAVHHRKGSEAHRQLCRYDPAKHCGLYESDYHDNVL